MVSFLQAWNLLANAAEEKKTMLTSPTVCDIMATPTGTSPSYGRSMSYASRVKPSAGLEGCRKVLRRQWQSTEAVNHRELSTTGNRARNFDAESWDKKSVGRDEARVPDPQRHE